VKNTSVGHVFRSSIMLYTHSLTSRLVGFTAAVIGDHISFCHDGNWRCWQPQGGACVLRVVDLLTHDLG